MKKIFGIIMSLVLLVGCGSNDYLTKDSVEVETEGYDLVEVADYQFYSSLTFANFDGIYDSGLTPEKYSIKTRQASTSVIDDSNYKEIYKSGMRYSVGKGSDTVDEDYEVTVEEFELRGVTAYKVTFKPNATMTSIAMFDVVSYFLPYENGTIEVMISGLVVETEELDMILNTIY